MASLIADKVAIIKKLHAMGAEKCTVEYSGSGDDGMIDEVFAEKGRKRLELDKELSDMVEEFAYEALSTYFGGWELNDGSTGSLIISVPDKEVTIHHNQNVMTVEEHQQSF